jgi:hypothetical protein
MKARTAVQITLSPKDHRRAKRLAKARGLFLATYLREAALRTMALDEIPPLTTGTASTEAPLWATVQ